MRRFIVGRRSSRGLDDVVAVVAGSFTINRYNPSKISSARRKKSLLG